jgi:Na+/H+ antiporter NhaD/arsenite permease-like protein
MPSNKNEEFRAALAYNAACLLKDLMPEATVVTMGMRVRVITNAGSWWLIFGDITIMMGPTGTLDYLQHQKELANPNYDPLAVVKDIAKRIRRSRLKRWRHHG